MTDTIKPRISFFTFVINFLILASLPGLAAFTVLSLFVASTYQNPIMTVAGLVVAAFFVLIGVVLLIVRKKVNTRTAK